MEFVVTHVILAPGACGRGAWNSIPCPISAEIRGNPRECDGKNRSFYARGVAKVKILTLMLRRNRFFYASH